MRRALAAVAVALALLVPVAVSAEGDNTAIAINTKDGSSLFKFSFKIARVMSDTVDTGNAAVAVASCTECQTTALAIQFVLLMSDPSVFTPENLALAMNVECTECDTLASAYQFVLQAGSPVRITADGLKRLHEIRAELAALADSGLSSFELQARIDELADEAYAVMQESLVPAGRVQAESPAPTSTSTSTTDTTAEPTTTTTSTTEPAESTTTTETTAP